MSHDKPSPDCADDLLLSDATSLREAIDHILGGGWCVPGGDRIDTIVALVTAVAPLVEQTERYSAWINLVRLDEHCKALGLAWPAPMEPFVGELFRGPDQTQIALIWSDHRGPLKAIHNVRTRGKVTKYVWSRSDPA